MALHGRPRYTGDLEIWVRRSTENAGRLMAALHERKRASAWCGIPSRSSRRLQYPGRFTAVSAQVIRSVESCGYYISTRKFGSNLEFSFMPFLA